MEAVAALAARPAAAAAAAGPVRPLLHSRCAAKAELAHLRIACQCRDNFRYEHKMQYDQS